MDQPLSDRAKARLDIVSGMVPGILIHGDRYKSILRELTRISRDERDSLKAAVDWVEDYIAEEERAKARSK